MYYLPARFTSVGSLLWSDEIAPQDLSSNTLVPNGQGVESEALQNIARISAHEYMLKACCSIGRLSALWQDRFHCDFTICPRPTCTL